MFLIAYQHRSLQRLVGQERKKLRGFPHHSDAHSRSKSHRPGSGGNQHALPVREEDLAGSLVRAHQLPVAAVSLNNIPRLRRRRRGEDWPR